MRALCAEALDAAVAGGAAYADARALSRRDQVVATRNGEVLTVNDQESEGIGVRVLVDGGWGFACDRRLTEEGAREAASRACAFARAAGGGRRRLAPVEAQSAEYGTPMRVDPFAISVGDKVGLCLGAEEGMRRDGVIVTSATLRAFRERKLLATTDGVEADQERVECGGGIQAIAATDGVVQTRSYPAGFGGWSGQAGWELVEGFAFERESARVGEEAVALTRAPVCPAGRTTVVLDADQMVAQLHESVGHPIELDRILGTEAAYAGTSFLSQADLGSLQYGSELMNVTADATLAGGLGSFAVDDEGSPARREAIVEAGVLRRFLSSRELGGGGSMRADSWNRMPLVRMTNLSLEPGEGSVEELLADVDEGVYLETNKSWSIDDKRLNFQFGTEAAWEIKGGKRGRLHRDATYTGITPPFWASLDGLAGPEHWVVIGATNCGKGQPGQVAHVSHGASPGRFRDVEVGVHA
ncbi:MAG: TldD/PmbA family protein [Thermoleophilia bacterium]|nr:TldD/PmbA family protein [Thermoleophilia bacterium]